ncbi:MAG: hypothetical protein U1E65_34180 [Myxococcota bacterium]
MTAPDEQAALAAVKRVQALNGPSLEARVRAEVGDPLIAMFALMAKHGAPGDDERQTAQKVQLMVLSYLARGEIEAKSPKK